MKVRLCNGDHDGPPCRDPECWQRVEDKPLPCDAAMTSLDGAFHAASAALTLLTLSHMAEHAETPGGVTEQDIHGAHELALRLVAALNDLGAGI